MGGGCGCRLCATPEARVEPGCDWAREPGWEVGWEDPAALSESRLVLQHIRPCSSVVLRPAPWMTREAAHSGEQR